ncbi:class I SAM-dependent methyltransferase [Taklimakanibacter deserti]|uniref:class I SAM-dependent methyltransferase n=1 Tax=Taklimakanibacter deserti TaxID=2267839 RepID=UPI0013C4838C
MTFAIPERIGWAVDIVAAEGSDSLLEVGCGRGVAVGLVAPQLTSGRILGLDRSANAIAAARKRNSTWEASGRASFVHSPLRDLVGDGNRFDKIFAINVNLFWTDPSAELPVVRKRLKEKGTLYLFYEPPESGRRQEIADKVAAGFSGSGLVIRKTIVKDVRGSPQLCLIAGLHR